MRPFDIRFVLSAFISLLPYVRVTLGIACASLSLGLALGAALAFGKLGRSHVARAVSSIYVYTIRCTPSIVLLFIVFYGIPRLVSALSGAPYFYGGKPFYVITCLTLISGASLCEVIRGAWYTVEAGQMDAARSLGLSDTQCVLHVMAPQVAAVALPNVVNSAANLIKQGALAYTIGLIDVMGQGQLIVARNFGAYGLETYIAMSLIFWGMCAAIETSAAALERRLRRGRRSVADGAGA